MKIVYRIFQRKPNVFIGHLERYLFAAHYCYMMDVFDAGAKDGYGSMILSHFAKSITLADRNSQYLGYAKFMYRFLCETDMINVDFENDFPNGEWDVIVAFEIIEHVKNCDTFVKNMSQHLKMDGKLIFSVPHMIANPDHEVLFDEKGIKDLISKYFIIDEFYIQNKEAVSEKPATSPPISYIGVARKK